MGFSRVVLPGPNVSADDGTAPSSPPLELVGVLSIGEALDVLLA
jgi:hypothetical protein